MEAYFTVRNKSEYRFTERKSEFIGYCSPVSSEEEAIAFVTSIKKKHSSATHNVYAYIVREGFACRFSDDGEPHGTAGMPVLDAMRKSGVTDTAIVVTRYFGGILLGTGGLVRAYTAAASGALKEACISEMKVFSLVSMKTDYSDYQKIIPIASSLDARLYDSEFTSDVRAVYRILDEKTEAFINDVVSATSGRASAIISRQICDFSD